MIMLILIQKNVQIYAIITCAQRGGPKHRRSTTKMPKNQTATQHQRGGHPLKLRRRLRLEQASEASGWARVRR